MENTPRKSKAFLITFIIVLLLLVVLYFMFKNRDKIFSTNSIGNKIFDPFENLFGKDEPKDPITTGGATGTGNTTGDDPTGGSTGGSGGGSGLDDPNSGNDFNNRNEYGYSIKDFDIDQSFSLSDFNYDYDFDSSNNNDNDNTDNGKKYACSDNKDNDGDGLIDTNDPGCHTDYDANNKLSYLRSFDDESRENSQDLNQNTDICPSYPLVFTAEEQDRLDALIRKFYLMAGTIRAEEDVLAIKDEQKKQIVLIEQMDDLITQCNQEKNSPSYTGPKIVKNNPYYQSGNTIDEVYVSGTDDTEMTIPIPTGTTTIKPFKINEILFNIW